MAAAVAGDEGGLVGETFFDGHGSSLPFVRRVGERQLRAAFAVEAEIGVGNGGRGGD